MDNYDILEQNSNIYYQVSGINSNITTVLASRFLTRFTLSYMGQ